MATEVPVDASQVGFGVSPFKYHASAGTYVCSQFGAIMYAAQDRKVKTLNLFEQSVMLYNIAINSIATKVAIATMERLMVYEWTGITLTRANKLVSIPCACTSHVLFHKLDELM